MIWILGVILIIAIAFLGLAASAWILQLAWNFVVPSVFGLVALTFWQAFALCVVLFVIGSFFRSISSI